MSEHNAQHTPGPWLWQHWPDGTETVAQASTLGTIATVQDGPILEEAQANARLIAAAPELLDALRAYFDDDDVGARLSSPRFIAARAAIAKATEGGK